MAKVKTSFFCQNCGAQASKWVGKCTSCQEWNTYVEEVISRPEKKGGYTAVTTTAKSPSLVSEIQLESVPKIKTNDAELNRVLGGGIVPGSVVLVGGEPGIGKSTLLLQLAISSSKRKVLYISGEESEQQIKMRAERIGIGSQSCFILSEISIDKIFKQIELLNPELLIIDSIQTLQSSLVDSSPGSVSQIRECTSQLIRYAKETNVPVFIVGHINKEGHIAGPKILEHMVDTVIQFEGDRNHLYRLLRSIKNRFGSTNELGIYEMKGEGLQEVSNPSMILMGDRSANLSGIAIASMVEGVRPMLIEIQALVSTAAYGTPQRSATGFDLKRLNMLLAVLEKRCGFKLAAKDVFLNITGGIKVDEPAIDLAVVCAILSSNEDMPIGPNVCFAAEVGLSGEIRPINRVDQRISEAEKMGFDKIIIPQGNLKGLVLDTIKIEVLPVKKIDQVFRLLFA